MPVMPDSLFKPETILDRPVSDSASGRSIDLVLHRKGWQVRRRRSYRVYLPAGYDGERDLPVVVVLHGCKQNHLDMQAITGFDAIADREGFIVVYPYITSHTFFRTRNCWGWWLPRQRLRDRGEIGDIHRMVAAVVSDYAVDESRLHICGLSAGAAMSVAALATYSDVWQSGASVAGVPYGESARAVKFSRFIPVRYKTLATLNRMLGKALVSEAPDLLVVQSTADRQVGLAASQNLVETWRDACSLAPQPGAFELGTSYRIPWRFARYADDAGRIRLAYLTVEDLEHGWIGGLPGRYSMTPAPNVSELIWAFFNKDQQNAAP